MYVLILNVETRPPSSPLYIRADPLSRQIIVSWSPADDGVLIRGFKLGYGTVTPEESWKSIDANQRIYTLTDLRKLNIKHKPH